MEFHAELPRDRLEIGVVAEDDRHLDRPLPGMGAREDVVEARGVLRHEDRHPEDLVRMVERPLGLPLTANQSPEVVGGLGVRHGDTRDVPLETRVVVVALGVHVLFVVEDAPPVVVDELGQAGRQAETKRAVQQQGDRTGLSRFVSGSVQRAPA